MEDLGIGAGLGAMAFWLFIAAVVVASYWDHIRKRETEHETIRRAIESGQQIDEEVLGRLVNIGAGSGRADRDLKLTALWLLPVAPGVLVLGYALGRISPEAFTALSGVAGLLACLALGFWIAGVIVSRWYQD